MDVLDCLLEHDAWTTRELLMCCRGVSDEAWSRPFEMGPGSLGATFAHVVGTMEHWADRVGDRPDRDEYTGGSAPSPGVDDLLDRLDAAATDLRAVARGVTASERLDEIMQLTYQGTTYRFTRGIALIHVATHGMHHRAQILNMLRHVGVEHDIEGDAITWELELGSGI